MENKEFTFKGTTLNGFLMLFVNLFLTLVSIAIIALGISIGDNACGITIGVGGILLAIATFIMWCGMMQLEPNEARVMMFFGQYKGTFTRVGYFWVNPFISTKKLSMRARNLDVEPIKVNDKTGNPVMIGLVLVWKLKDTYKAMFEIDSQTMAQSGNQNAVGNSVSSVMKAFENFVKIQSDAALRQTAGLYAYDDNEQNTGELTLRSRGDKQTTGGETGRASQHGGHRDCGGTHQLSGVCSRDCGRDVAPSAGFCHNHGKREDCGRCCVDGENGASKTFR